MGLYLVQKWPSEVFFAKRCSQKFHKIHRKTPVPESLFKQSCKPEASNFIKKKTLAQVFSCGFCEISKNTFFTEHLWTTASASPLVIYFLVCSISRHPWKYISIDRRYFYCISTTHMTSICNKKTFRQKYCLFMFEQMSLQNFIIL